MNADQVRIIERLRAAGTEHGEVSDLLDVLAETLSTYLFDGGDIHINDEQGIYLKAAVTAASFVQYDREKEEHDGREGCAS